MSDGEQALQEAPATAPASGAAVALAGEVLGGEHPVGETVERIAAHFTALPRIEVFVAALTTFPPEDPTGWRPLGGRAWVREWRSPGATCSTLPPPDAGPEAALSMPWVSQFARNDVVALVDSELLPDVAAQDRRELAGVGIRSFVAAATQGQGQMFGSLSLGSTEAGPWPQEHIADMRLLNAALAARIGLEQARRSVADSVAASARTREVNEQLLASVGHELRTPLTSVLGHAEMLIDEAQLADEHPLVGAIQRDGDAILRACEQLLGLVDGLLDAGRTLRADTDRSDVEVAAAVDDVLHWHRSAARRADVTLTSDVGPGLSVWAHAAALRQVLSILVGNAVQHNRRGGSVTVTARPLVGEVGEQRLRVVVRDSGPGLDRDQLQELFKPNGRLDGTGLDGKGLSLSLSRSLAERDNGTVGVESAPGAGSVFWLELPARRTDSRQPGALR